MATTTTDRIIDDILRREGGAAVTNDPADRGGRTQYGIAEASNPEAWADGKVEEAEARGIYYRKYIQPFRPTHLGNHPTFAQLVDWGVVSGPTLVVQKLQHLVGAEVDGSLGPETLASIQRVDPLRLNVELVKERIRMIGRLVAKNPSQVKFLNGWLARALEFL